MLLDPAIRPQVSELTMELSDALEVLPGLSLQPGLQDLIHPGGSPSTPNALALGVNAVVSTMLLLAAVALVLRPGNR